MKMTHFQYLAVVTTLMLSGSLATAAEQNPLRLATLAAALDTQHVADPDNKANPPVAQKQPDQPPAAADKPNQDVPPPPAADQKPNKDAPPPPPAADQKPNKDAPPPPPAADQNPNKDAPPPPPAADQNPNKDAPAKPDNADKK